MNVDINDMLDYFSSKSLEGVSHAEFSNNELIIFGGHGSSTMYRIENGEVVIYRNIKVDNDIHTQTMKSLLRNLKIKCLESND